LLMSLRERSSTVSVGATNILPLDTGWRFAFRMPEQPAADVTQQQMVQYHSVSDGYFSTIGVPLLRGRDFDERDTPDNPGVVIVNEAFVKRYFAAEDPIGKTIISVPNAIGPLGLSLMKDRAHQIVGVVGDTKNQRLRGTV